MIIEMFVGLKNSVGNISVKNSFMVTITESLEKAMQVTMIPIKLAWILRGVREI